MKSFDEYIKAQTNPILENLMEQGYRIEYPNKIFLNSTSSMDTMLESKALKDAYGISGIVEKENSGYVMYVNEGIMDMIKAGIGAVKNTAIDLKAKYAEERARIARQNDNKKLETLFNNVLVAIDRELFGKLPSTTFEVITKDELKQDIQNFYTYFIQPKFNPRNYGDKVLQGAKDLVKPNSPESIK
jgi:hypothetical protein